MKPMKLDGNQHMWPLWGTLQGQNCGKGGLVAASRYTVTTVGVSGVLTRGMFACMNREAK